MKRRDFLKTAAAGIALPCYINRSALGSQGRPPASERIVMGAIGVGGRGTGDLQLLMNDLRVQYVAVCDVQQRNRQRAAKLVRDKYSADKQWSGCKEYVEFEQLLDRDDIDAVNIATPDHWHALIVTAAARAGKDMYSQKPLALTIVQGRRMVEAVNRFGILFQTGTQQRSDARFRRACELVRNGRIGKLRHVDVEVPGSMLTDTFGYAPAPQSIDYDRWLGPAPKRPYSPQVVDPFGWRWILDFAGGCVTDWGAHHMDIAHWGMGATRTGPVEVHGEGHFGRDGLFDTAAYWKFECLYETGVTVTCFAKAPFTPGQYPNDITFIGSKGKVFINRSRIDADPKSILKEEIGPDEIHLYPSNNHYRNFIDCVISRKEPAAPIEEAQRSITPCHLGNIAMRLRRAIQWDPKTESVTGDDQASKMLARPLRSPWRFS